MSKLCFNLDDVIGGIEKMHLVTLQHAAEISPYVTERTIGPDLAPWQDRVHHKEDKQPVTKNTDDKEAKVTKQGAKSEQPERGTPTRDAKDDPKDRPPLIVSPLPQLSPPPIQNYLDYQTINTSVLMREAEQRRKQLTRQQVCSMQQKHVAFHKRSMEREQAQLQERAKRLEEKRRTDTELVQAAEQQAAQEVQQQTQQVDLLRQQTQRQLQMISFQGVSKYQQKFRVKYEIVAKLIISIDKQALLACGEYNRQLKELIQMFEQLLSKMKAGDCGSTELKTAENLCKLLDTLEESIITELENLVKREQQRTDELKQLQREQEEKKRLEQEQQQQQQVETATATETATNNAVLEATSSPPASVTQTDAAPVATTPVSAAVATESSAQYVSAERFQFYTQINSFYQQKVDRVKPLQTDEAMKKYRFACQKAINIPVNAISAVSPQHLQDKFEKLFNFIAGQPLNTADGQISVNDHPLGRDYCILLMAKKFVSQGDTAISSNPQAAFPVASVIVSLWKLVPDFGQIFLAYTYKESPFLVPYFIPQKRGQPMQEYYKVLGYRVSADGQLEQQDMYLKRQAGIARLYAAVMITSGRQLDAAAPHPYPLDHGWRWLTNFVQLEPLPDICATLMLEFLQFVGTDMWRTYGRQFVKLLLYIQQQYFPKLSAVDEGGPKARLELLLSKFLREGQIQKAQGLLPNGFW